MRATKTDIRSFQTSVETRLNGMSRDLDQMGAKVQALNQENYELKQKVAELSAQIVLLTPPAEQEVAEQSASQGHDVP